MAKKKRALYHDPNAPAEAFDPKTFKLPLREFEKKEIKLAKADIALHADDPSPEGREIYRAAVITLHDYGIKIPVRRTLPKDHEWEVFAEVGPTEPYKAPAAATETAAKMEILRVEDFLDSKSYEKTAQEFYEQFVVPGDVTGAWAVLEKSMANYSIELDKFEQAMAVVLSEKHPGIDTGKYFGILAWVKFNISQAKALLNAAKESGEIMSALKESVVLNLMGNKSAAFDAAEPMRKSYDPDVVLASLALCQ